MSLPTVFHRDYQVPLRQGHRFPMSKYGYVRDALVREGIVPTGGFAPPALANPPLLALAHDASYVERVLALSLSAEEERRIGLPVSATMRRRVRLSAAGTWQAARLALEHGVACNVAGGAHHADHAGGAGFCIFNDVAIAARALVRGRLVRRVAVVDLNVHQGDGTARIFQNDGAVFTLSIHAAQNFPAEKACGDLDVALPDGTGDAAYLNALCEALERVPDADIVFYNAGVDPHRDDRLGRLSLSDQGIIARDRQVMAWARRQGCPIVGVLGGGYGSDPEKIAARHLSLFRAADASLRGQI